MSNLTKWGDWSDEGAKADAAITKTGSKSYLKLAEGDNVLRFLPPKPGKPTPLASTFSHYMEMPDGRKFSFNCPRMMARKACPVCAKGDQLKASRSLADQKLAGRMFPRLRVYANVIDRNAEEMGVQIFAFGKTIMDDLTAIRQNARKGGNFTHPETGRDIIITRTGKSQQDTRYGVNPDVQSSPLHSDQAQMFAWLDAAYDLDSFMSVLDDDALRAKLRGDEPPREEKVIAVKPRGRTIEDDADSFDTDSF